MSKRRSAANQPSTALAAAAALVAGLTAAAPAPQAAPTEPQAPALELAALLPAPWEYGAPDAAAPAADPVPFAKLDKAALPAKGTPEREQYRKARRAAARALRKRLAA